MNTNVMLSCNARQKSPPTSRDEVFLMEAAELYSLCLAAYEKAKEQAELVETPEHQATCGCSSGRPCDLRVRANETLGLAADSVATALREIALMPEFI